MTKLFWGGGTIADTISDVPSAIDGMLGNYKKVAIIDLVEYPFEYMNGGTADIKMNFQFSPKYVYFNFTFKQTSSGAWYYYGSHEMKNGIEKNIVIRDMEIKILERNDNHIKIDYRDSGGAYNGIKISVIAIE